MHRLCRVCEAQLLSAGLLLLWSFVGCAAYLVNRRFRLLRNSYHLYTSQDAAVCSAKVVAATANNTRNKAVTLKSSQQAQQAPTVKPSLAEQQVKETPDWASADVSVLEPSWGVCDTSSQLLLVPPAMAHLSHAGALICPSGNCILDAGNGRRRVMTSAASASNAHGAAYGRCSMMMTSPCGC